MKNSYRLLVYIFIAFFTVFPARAGKIPPGPMSKLFLTAGENNMNWVVQGSSVVNSWTQHNGGEYPLAVFNTVRTLGLGSGFNGSEYTLNGAFTGVTYPYPPIGITSDVYDGTTDTTSNYSVDYNSGNVYSFNGDWTNPTLLFSEPIGFLGITYDATDNSLWLANFNGTIVEHRSLFGTLISSFTVPFTSITCLALDPADNTLWMGSQNTQGTFYQYSKTGSQLSTVTYPALVTQNTLGGEFQALLPTGQLEVNGQGTIVGPSGKKVSFAFLDVENEQVTKQYLEGILAYQDKGSQDSFQTGKITSVLASGNEAVISGTATIGGKHQQTVNFTIKVTGNQNPATNDTFSVSLSNGYTASGNLTSGFISIERDE
jgi:hypothetical protein